MRKSVAQLAEFLKSWGKESSLHGREYVVVPLKDINQAAEWLSEMQAVLEEVQDWGLAEGNGSFKQNQYIDELYAKIKNCVGGR